MTIPGRPYAQLGIAELEKLVQDTPSHRTTNEAVLAELKHRNTMRARTLRQRLERLLLLPQSSPAAADLTPAPARTSSTAPPEPAAPASLISRLEPRLITDDPKDILRAWIALEVLSPATFRKPAELAGGDMRRIARFDCGLPWAGGIAKGPPGARLYFQVVLGTIAMQPAIDQLLQRFADTRPERPQARGETPLAVIIVDREGRPFLTPARSSLASVGVFPLPSPVTLRRSADGNLMRNGCRPRCTNAFTEKAATARQCLSI